jgi:competence protein ComGC
MNSLFREFWLFLRQEKKWWLVPMLVVMGVVAILVVVTVLFPGAAPFLYPLL